MASALIKSYNPGHYSKAFKFIYYSALGHNTLYSALCIMEGVVLYLIFNHELLLLIDHSFKCLHKHWGN